MPTPKTKAQTYTQKIRDRALSSEAALKKLQMEIPEFVSGYLTLLSDNARLECSRDKHVAIFREFRKAFRHSMQVHIMLAPDSKQDRHYRKALKQALDTFEGLMPKVIGASHPGVYHQFMDRARKDGTIASYAGIDQLPATESLDKLRELLAQIQSFVPDFRQVERNKRISRPEPMNIVRNARSIADKGRKRNGGWVIHAPGLGTAKSKTARQTSPPLEVRFVDEIEKELSKAA